MKVMVTGTLGMLGSEVMKVLQQRGFEAVGMHREVMDITDRGSVLSHVIREKPDAIIHCASWTDVDAAEQPENRDIVYRVNADGTRNVAEAAGDIDSKLVYISTDYVFGGEGCDPRKPDDREFAPLNYYGYTKLEGEKAVAEYTDKYFIVRTSWLFGSNGRNFISSIIDAGRKHDDVRVVNDQIGTPTYACDLASLLVDMITTDKYGVYHATNAETEPGGYISWCDFAKEIYRQIGCDTEVIPVSTEEYGVRAAARPLNSRLDKNKLIEAGFRPLPDWKGAVRRYIIEAGI